MTDEQPNLDDIAATIVATAPLCRRLGWHRYVRAVAGSLIGPATADKDSVDQAADAATVLRATVEVLELWVRDGFEADKAGRERMVDDIAQCFRDVRVDVRDFSAGD